MEIYVVQPGDTIASIALKFGITVEKLINENSIEMPYSLVVGQTLVITFPTQVYLVKEGDSLSGIAKEFNVTVMQLFRNNPYIVNRQYIYPGETIVISYDYKGSELVVGYTYPYIREDILKKTLPYLTYLLIFNYRIASNGELVGSDEDIEVIRTAKLYETASTLVLTSYSNIGDINLQVEYEVLLDEQLQDRIINNLLRILREKGYNGVNLAFQFIDVTNQHLYLNFLINVSNRLHPEGYSVFLTINPGLTYTEKEISFEKINYTAFSSVSDGILFLSYDWGSIDRPPTQTYSALSASFLDYIIIQIPLEKIRIGLPTLGYDWRLPYVEGQTRANALNFDSVMALARETNSVIYYDEKSFTAYFEYTDINNDQHIVWFKDARSIDSSLKLLQSYGIYGIGIWNIMNYFSQMWLVINSQYQIITI